MKHIKELKKVSAELEKARILLCLIKAANKNGSAEVLKFVAEVIKEME
mgnify:CR=1 FL=1